MDVPRRIPDGQAGGAEPAVVFGIVDVIEPTRAVPVEEFAHALLGDGLPFARIEAVLLLGVHDIDHGAGLLVVHGHIDVIDIIGVEVARQHMDQNVVIAAARLLGEEGPVFLTADGLPLLGAQAAVLLHDPIRQGHGVGGTGRGGSGQRREVDGVVDVLVRHGIDIEDEAQNQGDQPEEHAAEHRGAQHLRCQRTAPALQTAHGPHTFYRHGHPPFNFFLSKYIITK